MKNKISLDEMLEKIENAQDLETLETVRLFYLGKQGIVTKMRQTLKDLDENAKKSLGKELGDFQRAFQAAYDSKKQGFKKAQLEKKLKEEQIDVTMPAVKWEKGAPHILEKVIEDLEGFFISMGYDVVEGPEVEKDLYNFEMLNLPKGHPARDAQDTFYIEGDEWLLRSQTSPVQVRTMLANKEKTPIRIICPGKTYRRDYDDATHSHQFTQMEGLVLSKNISLSDLKGTLNLMAKHLFGESAETRFRPSFYPFTEPSVEFDVSCFKCGQKGCNVCKGTGWITIGGAGVVHPNVLTMSGYDKEKYQGFAFGFGIERIAMIKYGIGDIRTFYVNDLRVLKQFDHKEESVL